MKNTKKTGNVNKTQESKESLINRLLKKKFDSSNSVSSLIMECGQCGCGEVVVSRPK
jgi:hypothetical protein